MSSWPAFASPLQTIELPCCRRPFGFRFVFQPAAPPMARATLTLDCPYCGAELTIELRTLTVSAN